MEKKIMDAVETAKTEAAFAIQVASFSSKEAAISFKEGMEDFKANAIETGKYWVVRVENLKSEKDALAMRKQLKIAGYDTALIK